MKSVIKEKLEAKFLSLIWSWKNEKLGLSKKLPVLYAVKFISNKETIVNFFPIHNMILERYAHYGISKKDIIEYIRNL